jgi:Uma2 family endonuclease
MVIMGTKTALTMAEFLALPEDAGVEYELSDGELVTMGKAGLRHERIKHFILRVLYGYENLHPEVGWVLAESLFRLGPETARMPDAAFLGAAKVALLPPDATMIGVAPDLAVEVISQSETAASAEQKVWEYLDAGVLEVWQVYPEKRRVHIRTTDRMFDLAGDQILETPVMPGFSVKVSAFFA